MHDVHIGCPAGHGTGVVMLQNSIGRQDVGVILLEAQNFRAFDVFTEEKLGFATFKGIDMQDFCIRTVGCHWPLFALRAQFLPLHSGKEGHDLGDFFQYSFCRIWCLCIPHAVHHLCQDLPIGFGLANRLHDFVDPLDAAFAVGERTFFFQKRGCGQDDVGITRRFGHKYFLDDEQIQ